MKIYSYFTSACKNLKDFLDKKLAKSNENFINETKKEESPSKERTCVRPIENLPEKKEEKFGSRALFLILKKTKIEDFFNKYVSDPCQIASTTYSLSSLHFPYSFTALKPIIMLKNNQMKNLSKNVNSQL